MLACNVTLLVFFPDRSDLFAPTGFLLLLLLRNTRLYLASYYNEVAGTMQFSSNILDAAGTGCLFIDPTHSTMQQYKKRTVVNWSEYEKTRG